jgi:hypothetical protein
MMTLIIDHIEAFPETVIVVSIVDETLLMYSIDDVKCRYWLELWGYVLLFGFLLLSFNGNLLLLRFLVMRFRVDILLTGFLLRYFLLFEISLLIFNESCHLMMIWLIGYGWNNLLMVFAGLGCHMTEIIAVRDNREGTAIRQFLSWHNHC